MAARSPIHWVLDFDGTITQQDTLNTLISISASTKPSFPTSEYWSQVSKAYLEDYTSTLSRLAPGGKLPCTIPEEKELLENLRAVEERSLSRVSSSGIFAGLTWKQLHTGAHQAVKHDKVKLRNGFTNFRKTIQSQPQQPDVITILSVNWSTHFIHSCLSSFHPSLPTPTILSNDLETLSPTAPTTPSTGHIIPSILSSGDKLQHLQRLRSEDTMHRPIVYVGDSWTDIEALLAADLGICMRDDPMGSSQQQLDDALERLGVECLRLGKLREGKGKGREEGKGGHVVWARDWEEISSWSESGVYEG